MATFDDFRPSVPSAARIYDYLLGGKDNYPADRKVAEALLARLPNARDVAHANRAFLRRVVRYLVTEAGVRQIIDIGAGLPSNGNTHEIAQDLDPSVRVVYVDHDPVVLAHSRNMLHQVPNTTVIRQQFNEPEKILADPELVRLIDFGEPCAIVLLAILHFVPDTDDPAGVITRLLERFPAGSHVAISHAVPDETSAVKDAEQDFEKAAQQAHVRGWAEVRRLVDGLELVPPGLVWLPEWRPDEGSVFPGGAADSFVRALVARKN